jgi:hypothetical protein
MEDSASPEFWVSSGARFLNDGGVGRTIQGELPPGDPWHDTYARTNPRDTDGGAHPQNVFRLVHRAPIENASDEVTFRVLGTNASASPNRNASNGVFVYLRWLGRDDAYEAGVRVDGNAVIKKKRHGTTLAIGGIFSNGAPYDRDANPSVLPARDVHLEGRIRTRPEGSVIVRLLVDGQLVLEAADTSDPILGAGMGGVSSDFADTELRGFGARPLSLRQ